jgi:hypothetical protein
LEIAKSCGINLTEADARSFTGLMSGSTILRQACQPALLAGQRCDEAKVLRAAAAFEKAGDWTKM